MPTIIPPPHPTHSHHGARKQTVVLPKWRGVRNLKDLNFKSDMNAALHSASLHTNKAKNHLQLPFALFLWHESTSLTSFHNAPTFLPHKWKRKQIHVEVLQENRCFAKKRFSITVLLRLHLFRCFMMLLFPGLCGQGRSKTNSNKQVNTRYQEFIFFG